MSYRVINEQDWQKYFNSISRQIPAGRDIELGVAASTFGDQIAEDSVQFEGISYDPREKVINVHTDILDHAIAEPREVVAIEEGEHLKALSIRDAAGNIQSIKFQ